MTLLCIDGVDGSGKSVFGDRLAKELARRGTRAAIVRVDDFRRAVEFSRAGADEAAIYYEQYYDFGRIEACLAAWRDGEAGFDLDVFDPALGRPGRRERIAFAGADVVLFEGVFTLRAPSARDGFLVWLEASAAEARRRLITRDTARGRAPGEVVRRIDRRYAPSQSRYRREYEPEARAEVVIDNEDVGAPRLRRAELARLPAPVRASIEALLG